MGGINYVMEELSLADHMLFVTFPLLNDKQIFLNALTHLGKAIKGVIELFIKWEVAYKRLKRPPDDMIINEFISKYSSKLGLKPYISMIREVTSFNNIRERSSIKLKRNNKFIVISPEYSMSALSISDAKDYLGLAREFINKMRSFIK